MIPNPTILAQVEVHIESKRTEIITTSHTKWTRGVFLYILRKNKTMKKEFELANLTCIVRLKSWYNNSEQIEYNV